MTFETKINQFLFLHLKTDDRKRLWRKLAKLIGNSVPIMMALESIHDRRARTHKDSDSMVMALKSWITGMKNGRRLSEMTKGWVSPEEQMLIAAGEQSGTIELSLLSSMRVMEARGKILKSVLAGLTYPVILLVLSFLVLYVFSIKVVPQFTKIVPAETYHGAAKFLIHLTDFSRDWILLIAIAIVALVVTFLFSLSRWDGPLRVWLDRYAPYSIYRMMVGSSWLISLAAMLEAGMRIENALKQLSALASPWLSTRIDAAMHGMRSGFNLGDALLRSGFEFPDREILDDLATYAALSGFDEALTVIGKEWLEDAVSEIESRMRIVFAVSIMGAALLIGSMAGGLADLEIQMMQAAQTRSR